MVQETALKLLRGASEAQGDVRYQITENYILMHTCEKNHVEKALENLCTLENQYVRIEIYLQYFVKNLIFLIRKSILV
jgi:hypothetical protein